MYKHYKKALFCGLLSVATAGVFAQQTPKEVSVSSSSSILKVDAVTGSSLQGKAVFQNSLKLSPQNDFKFKKQETDQLGFNHQRFQQTYKGVNIEFAVPVIHSKNGVTQSVSGEFYNVEDLSVTAGIPATVAFSNALRHMGAQSYLWEDAGASQELGYEKPEGELLILPVYDADGGVTMKLAYKFDIYSIVPLGGGDLYMDAQTGDALFFNNKVRHVGNFGHDGRAEFGTVSTTTTKEEIVETLEAVVGGTAATRYSGSRPIETTLSGGSYTLNDASRKVYTRDANNQAPIGNSLPYINNYSEFTDNDNNWTAAEYNNSNKDNAALDAHWGAMRTYDYWSQVHNRDSYNGSGAQLRSYIHVDNNYDNAFWFLNVMSYGDGSSNGNEGNGFFDALTSLDVAAHEIGHAVTEFTANLAYQRESGGLNEAYSDIWGAAIEHFAKGNGSDANPSADIWLIGDEIDRRSGSAALRSMSDPKSLGQPDTYGGTFWQNPNCGTPTDNNDYCGVHTNSGVLNHWFYLAVAGGSGSNDVGDVYNVAGIGMNKAAQISYRALNVYMSANTTYAQARTALIQSAVDLYGAGGAEEAAVTNAMYAVNVGDAFIVVGPPTCDSTVSSFPYNEGFENTLGQWSQGSGDDFDWTVNSGGTASSSTGPSAAAQGTYYVYAETSNPNNPSKTTILNSPCFNFSGAGAPEATFKYQMTGNAVGSVRLEAREDGSTTWSQVWSKAGDQGAAWLDATVDLSAYGGDTVQLRFVATSGNSWQGDIALDDFGVTASAPDTQAPSVPTSLSVSAVTDTTIDLSWNASSDNVGVTGYDVYQGTALLGSVVGTSANVTDLTEGTTYSFTVRAKDAAGNVSNTSNPVNGTTTGGATSGCAGGVNTFPYGESFEANLGLWSQGGGDDLNWTRDSSGTPSSGTGPSTGSQGSFYMFVEASGDGTGYPNKSARLNSPCFDLTSETDATFTFDYHANGTGTMGTIAVEASADGGTTWSSLWSQSSYQGNSWTTQSVSLAAYAGGSVQLRFARVTGNTWQADVAIDNAQLTGSGSGNTEPPSGYCASNGNSVADEFIQRVQIGSINNSTGASSGGYGDYTNLSTSLNATNTITITPSWTGTIYNEGYAVFVDWNRDGDFGDAGETVYTRAASSATPITGTFNVPAGAQSGATRMRVSMQYDGIPAACGSFQYGEVEDYIVTIGSATSFNSFANEMTLATVAEDLLISNLSVQLHPNPVTGGRLNIDVQGAEATEITILNLLGQVVRKDAFESTLDVSNLEAGVYIIQIATDNASVIKRFVKK